MQYTDEYFLDVKCFKPQIEERAAAKAICLASSTLESFYSDGLRQLARLVERTTCNDVRMRISKGTYQRRLISSSVEDVS